MDCFKLQEEGRGTGNNGHVCGEDQERRNGTECSWMRGSEGLLIADDHFEGVVRKKR